MLGVDFEFRDLSLLRARNRKERNEAVKGRIRHDCSTINFPASFREACHAPTFTAGAGRAFCFMNWINIQTATLRSPQFIGSDPTARGTWLAVLGYCYEQENGGKILGCIGWKDRQWQQICGVTRNEIDGSSSLMQWQGDDLCVWSYPIETEDELKAKRAAGSKGGKARSQAKIEAARANGAKHNPSTTQAQPKQPPNEIEKKGKEKEKEAKAPVPVALTLSSDEPAKPKPAKREPIARNELLDAFAQACGCNPRFVTPKAWPQFGVALAEIKAVCPEVTAAELYRHAENYVTHMSNAMLTPMALAKHWALCDKPNPRAPQPAQESEFANAF